MPSCFEICLLPVLLNKVSLIAYLNCFSLHHLITISKDDLSKFVEVLDVYLILVSLCQQLKLVMDSIIWAFRHTERNVAETGLNLLLEMLTNFQVIFNFTHSSLHAREHMHLVYVFVVVLYFLYGLGFVNSTFIAAKYV